MKKQTVNKNSQALFDLMDEVGKLEPDRKLIKNLCEKADVAYEEDIIQLMTKVLVAASHVKSNTNKTSLEV